MTTADQGSRQPPEASGSADRIRVFAAIAVASLVLLGFIALIAYLAGKAGSATDGAWSRYIYLFGGLEALAFTALGWLFGREVNRQAVQHAEARADQASNKAEAAAERAAAQETNGRALRAAVETRAEDPNIRSLLQNRQTDAEPADDDQTYDLVALARALFPDR